MKTGEKIKELREQRGMSQDDLAKAVGYKTRSSIAKIEKGESDPSQKKLVRIAEALEVRPSELLGEDSAKVVTVHIPNLAPVFEESYIQVKHPEVRILAKGFDAMPEAERKRALALARTIFDQYAHLFDEKEQKK